MAHVIEQDSSGSYSVCVFNADSASDEEITEIFEQFGPVVHINRCKTLVFVRYSTFEEASLCLEKMKNHSKFYVKPAKQKLTPDKAEYQRNRDRVQDHRKGAEMSNWKKESDTSSQSTETQSAMNKMPDLKFDEPETDAVAIASELSLRVTIAHLPPDFLQCDIYLLCSKARASPLQVDMRSFTRHPHSPVNYAIVYVKSSADVENIVRGLNNLKVNGYQLVVAPYEKLVEEGRTTHRNK